MGIEENSKCEKKQEWTQKDNYCKWVKEKNALREWGGKKKKGKKQKAGGGKGVVKTLVGFAWLDWHLKHILNGATTGNEFDKPEHGCSKRLSFGDFRKCPQGAWADEVLVGLQLLCLWTHGEKQGFELQLGCNFYCKCNHKCKVSK